MIVMATCRCIDPVLTIVAAMAWGKPVFLSPPDKREEANAARKKLAADSAGELLDTTRPYQYLSGINPVLHSEQSTEATKSQSILALALWAAGRASSRFRVHAAARSDHLLMVAAFSAWDTARREQGRQAAFQAGGF